MAAGHYPMIFCVDSISVGVVRIDLDEEIQEAIFRRVAIMSSEQRKGFGRKLMEAAERFALDRGYQKLVANVAIDAIPFYEKIGYTFDPDTAATSDPSNPRMIKIGNGYQIARLNRMGCRPFCESALRSAKE